MALQEKLDEIVNAATAKMLTLTDEDEINTVVTRANDQLDRVITSGQAERNKRIAAKRKLAALQTSIHSLRRDEALDSLIETAGELKLASKRMNEAAANNILTRIATVGNALIATAESAEELAGALKTAAQNPADMNAEDLSEKVNTALDNIQALKKL